MGEPTGSRRSYVKKAPREVLSFPPARKGRCLPKAIAAGVRIRPCGTRRPPAISRHGGTQRQGKLRALVGARGMTPPMAGDPGPCHPVGWPPKTRPRPDPRNWAGSKPATPSPTYIIAGSRDDPSRRTYKSLPTLEVSFVNEGTDQILQITGASCKGNWPWNSDENLLCGCSRQGLFYLFADPTREPNANQRPRRPATAQISVCCAKLFQRTRPVRCRTRTGGLLINPPKAVQLWAAPPSLERRGLVEPKNKTPAATNKPHPCRSYPDRRRPATMVSHRCYRATAVLPRTKEGMFSAVPQWPRSRRCLQRNCLKAPGWSRKGNRPRAFFPRRPLNFLPGEFVCPEGRLQVLREWSRSFQKVSNRARKAVVVIWAVVDSRDR